MIGRAIGRYQ